MFGLEYLLAGQKVAIELALIIVTSLPLWLSWNCIIPKYFSTYVPELYHMFPYWHVVAILIIIKYIGQVIGQFTHAVIPKLFEINIGK